MPSKTRGRGAPAGPDRSGRGAAPWRDSHLLQDCSPEDPVVCICAIGLHFLTAVIGVCEIAPISYEFGPE
jgi:hypothetical protein